LVVGSAFKHGTPLNFVKGELDDVRLFNNTMTANQVKTSMQ